MTVMSYNAAPTVHLETLEGERLGVSRVRHPSSGIQCLSFTGPEGRRVALVPSKAIMSVRQRVWQVASTAGTYTLGPVDMAMLRKLAA
ncbi:hypothetical protein NOCA2530035 [metagenome]|uniref:Uncharacterized protein n=1 Tax=metagenome TaxID=256318 RepID=A0A2P2C9K1_9ZZZZ